MLLYARDFDTRVARRMAINVSRETRAHNVVLSLCVYYVPAKLNCIGQAGH